MQAAAAGGDLFYSPQPAGSKEAIYLHPLPPSQQQRGARYLFSHYRQEAANDAQRPSRKFIARAEKSTGRNDEKGRQDFDFSQFCKLEFSL